MRASVAAPATAASSVALVMAVWRQRLRRRVRRRAPPMLSTVLRHVQHGTSMVPHLLSNIEALKQVLAKVQAEGDDPVLVVQALQAERQRRQMALQLQSGQVARGP